MNTVGKRIREAMEMRSMSQSDLVRATGIGKSSISTYLSGEYEPKQRNAAKIARALRVSESWLMGVSEEKMEVPGETQENACFEKAVFKPRLGVIACGVPILAQQNIECYDLVPESIKCDFTLQCHGDSMINARILDGDIVYIRHQPQVENGEIAAVLVENEATLKRVYIYDDQLVLQAENVAYAPLVYRDEKLEHITIIGKAVGFTSTIK